MVLAGPGSGKTSVIVERTAYMINEEDTGFFYFGCNFFQSSGNRDERTVLKFVGQNRSEVTFGTFHGIFMGF